MKNHKWQEVELPLGLYLHFLTKNFVGAMAQRLQQMGIDRYFRILIVVEQSNESFKQQDLADYFQMSKVSMVRIIDYLTKNGFLERQVNENDRREYFLILTDKSRKALPEIKQCMKEMNEVAFKGFTPEQKEQFLQSLKLMYANLSQLPFDDVFLDFTKIKDKKIKGSKTLAPLNEL